MRLLVFFIVSFLSAYNLVAGPCSQPGGIAVSSDINYGNVLPSSVSSAPVSVKNSSGNLQLQINGIAHRGFPFPPEINFDPRVSFPTCLNPGDERVIGDFIFTAPDNPGAYSNTFYVLVFDGVREFATAAFTVKATIISPSISVSPSSLDFGTIASGETSAETFDIVNPNSVELTIDDVVSDDKSFQVTSPKFPTKIGKGRTRVTIAFQPTKPGNYGGRINVIVSGKTVATVNVAGTAREEEPEINIQPQDLNFGSVDVGTFSKRDFTISNSGKGDLDVFVPSDRFIRTHPSGNFRIAPNRNVNVQVSLIADSKGPINKTIVVESNDPDERRVSIRLTAVGIASDVGLVDRTTSSGITNNNKNETTGVQWIDFNNDGKQDLFFTGKNGNVLFRNAGHNHFVNVTGSSNLGSQGKNVRGAAWADVDNDGKPDVFLANFDGSSQILKNIGGGKFANKNFALGLTASENGPSATGGIWLDFNNDSRIDLFVTRENSSNLLFKNIGGFQFANVASQAGVALKGPSRSAVAADFDDDGYQDLYVVSYNRPNKMYLNNKNETFRDVTASSGTEFSGPSVSATVADYDADGDLDLFVANSNGSSVLYRNTGHMKFQKATAAAGLTGPKKITSATFSDYDNDGDQDLLVVQTGGENILFRNNGKGKFTRIDNVDFSNADNPSSVGSGDGNNDGRIDVVIGDGDSGEDGGDSFYDNLGGEGKHWLVLTLVGTRSNRSAIGAKVIVKTGLILQAAVVSGGNGQSQESLPLEFGLGAATSASIIVAWPDGTLQSRVDVSADQKLRIEQSPQ